MSTPVLMPALSPTMTEGTLARWLKKEGDTIKAGDIIAEIETDKATMEVEAVDEGILGKILVADGTANVAVNAPIAVLVEAGEAVPSGAPAPAPAPAAAPVPAPAAAASAAAATVAPAPAAQAAAAALARASRCASKRGISPRAGVSSISVARISSGTTPIWASSANRRGLAEARTRRGRITSGGRSLEPEGDAAFGQVVRGHLDVHPIASQHANAILAHLAAGVGQDHVLIVQLDSEHGVREQFRDRAAELDHVFF